ncbi:MAG: TonB family protein [Cytophagales bacterium]|nr:TonB family protein [Cytophagales bacterium]
MRQIKFFWLLGILVFFCEESDAQEIYFDKAGNRTNEKGKSFFYQRKMVDTLSLRDTVFLVYSENDALFGREIYNKGKLNGPFTYYYKDGRVKERGSYAENQKVDYNFNYYESGNPKSTLYYPKKQRQVSDFKEYDFLIINYWNEEGKQIINNGNGSCNCRFDYLRANPVTSTNPKNYSTLFFEEAYYDDDNPEGGKASYREIGKVIDGLRDSVWFAYDGADSLLHKETFINGIFKTGESYKAGKIYKYDKLFMPLGGGVNGLANFYQSVGERMNYPPKARRMGVQGEVWVEFQIIGDGIISEFRIIKSVGSGCDEEAIRAIKLSQSKINPAKKRGQPIKSKFAMPVIFKLG